MKLAGIHKAFIYIYVMLLSSYSVAAEGMPQFNAKSFNSQLFWLTVTFGLLYILVTYLILPRIRENIRLRKNKISNDLERAENIKLEIEKMISLSNNKIEEAKNKVKNLIKEANLRSNKEYNNQIETFKKQIANKQQTAEEAIQSFKDNIDNDIEKAAIPLSAIILNKLNYNNLSSEDIEKILIKSSESKNV